MPTEGHAQRIKYNRVGLNGLAASISNGHQPHSEPKEVTLHLAIGYLCMWIDKLKQ